MIIQQHYLACLSQASYLIADEESGEAAVVDPRRDVDIYLEAAAELRVSIRHVLLTHLHADFLAGHLELAARTQASIAIGRRAQTHFNARPLAEGDVITLGGVRLEILETPGHTPESICIVVREGSPAEHHPRAVLTGDTLFIGDVGRPDLLASAGLSAEELAGMLHDSIHRKLLSLPDETLVYPGHGAGSMCGKNLSTETVSTIGRQRLLNHALQPMSRDEFIAIVTVGQPPAPRYFPHDAALNRAARPLLEERLETALVPLQPEEFLRLVNSGLAILDSRDADAYASSHLPGSINIALDGRFSSWVGTVFAPDEPFLVVAPVGRERETAVRLGRIGYEGNMRGFLEGGLPALQRTGASLRTSRRVDPEEAARLLEADPDALVLDVRRPPEWKAESLPRSVFVPVAELEERLDEVPRDRSLLLLCRTGYRSSLAAGLLERHGINETIDIAGGLTAWKEAGLPTAGRDQAVDQGQMPRDS